jgi:hypothetical protein
MDRVVKSTERSPHTVIGIGIAVHQSSSHIGMLYRTAEGEPAKILHLAWHHQLSSDHPSTSYPCWVRPRIPDERALAIAAFCRRIWKKASQDQVPYGFSVPSAFFDYSGALISGPAKVGLTCASFVLAVFDGAGLPLVRMDEWPPPTLVDKARQRELLDELRKSSNVSPAHLSALETEIGNVRYRPLEVAGAGTAEILPASHAYASEMASKIKDFLDSLSVAATQREPHQD